MRAPFQQASTTARSVTVEFIWFQSESIDVICRIIFARLSERLGQGFAVENRPGAAGTIAAQAVARAPADGYTLLYDATAHSVNPSLFGTRLPYDTRRELLPVFLAMVTPNTLMATNGFGPKTVPELIAHAKANPGTLDCASTGIGTVQHVSLELLNHRAGIPGFAETLPGFETWEWNGVFAPAGTPAEAIARLNAELNATIRDATVAERLGGLGALTRANTVEEFAAFREQQIGFFAEMVQMANIRID
ncbi:MAG: hypothetical protein EON47_20625 [Acetobacteraceae bacterium]|nr:MAG: hypothetical protein EON47_20625 [Acetobacteraceae bacterium]